MGSILKTLSLIAYYSWIRSKGALIILLGSPWLYFLNYNSRYKDYFLLNVFVINIIQILKLNRIIMCDEVKRFLNFYNVSDISIYIARFLFLFSFFLLHMFLFITLRELSFAIYLILNLIVLVLVTFRLFSWNLKRNISIIGFVVLIMSQIAILSFTNYSVIICSNIILIFTFLGFKKFNYQNKYE